MKSFFSTVALFLWVNCALAQQQFIGYVYIDDSIARPKFQAEVEVKENEEPPTLLKTYFDGSFKFTPNKNKTYSIKIHVPGFRDTAYTIASNKNAIPEPATWKVVLKKDGIRLTGMVKSVEENFPINEATVVLRNIMTRQEDRFTTGLNGVYNFKLEYETNYRLTVDKRSPGIINMYQDTAFFISTINFNQPATFKFDILLNESRKKVVLPEGYDAERNPVNKNLKPVVKVIGLADSAAKVENNVVAIPEKLAEKEKIPLVEKPEPKPIHFTIQVNEHRKNKPVKGATVRLKTIKNLELIKTTTEGNGKCTFDLESDKKYILTVSQPGYITLSDTIKTPLSVAEMNLGLNYILYSESILTKETEKVVVPEVKQTEPSVLDTTVKTDVKQTVITTTNEVSVIVPIKDSFPEVTLVETEKKSNEATIESSSLKPIVSSTDTVVRNTSTYTIIDSGRTLIADSAVVEIPVIDTLPKTNVVVFSDTVLLTDVKNPSPDSSAFSLNKSLSSPSDKPKQDTAILSNDTVTVPVKVTVPSWASETKQTDTPVVESILVKQDTTQSTIIPYIDSSSLLSEKKFEGEKSKISINFSDSIQFVYDPFVTLKFLITDSLYRTPIQGAAVIVKNLETRQFRQSLTDEDGTVDFSMTKGKHFSVFLRKSNYRSVLDTFAILNERANVAPVVKYRMMEAITDTIASDLPTAYFAKNQVTLSDSMRNAVKNIFRSVAKNKDVRVRLYGLSTKDETNPELISTKRLDAVITCIIQAGIDGAQITSYNLSTMKPRIRCNESPCPEGVLNANRCVVFEIIFD
jgi:hypothetical protein